jgi:hypothetical protein
MTARRKKPELSPEIADDLRRVIALLAEACADADRRRLRWRLGGAPGSRPVRPVAAALVRYLAEGNRAKARELLSVRRTQAEWQRLAVALASAADPARLELPAPPKPRSRAA